MNIGDILVQWSFRWGSNDKDFEQHTIIKITPSGRIKTDKGLELNPDLSIRGKSPYRSYISLLTDKIKKEMLEQKQKDELELHLHELDVHSLTADEISSLNEIFNQIVKRVAGKKSI